MKLTKKTNDYSVRDYPIRIVPIGEEKIRLSLFDMFDIHGKLGPIGGKKWCHDMATSETYLELEGTYARGLVLELDGRMDATMLVNETTGEIMDIVSRDYFEKEDISIN